MSELESDSEPERTGTVPSPAERGDAILAAGAVLWRPGPTGEPEIAVVHRPRYGDWSLPKGKLDPGETIAHAAAREVVEETGLDCVLSRHLRRIGYEVPRGPDTRADKFVHYFAARALPGEFVANEEVDQLRWVPVARAHEWLTYADDHGVVNSFESLPTTMSTVLLVRHADAGERAESHGDDNLRPLSDAGWRQEKELHSLLSLFGPERVYSAPRLRCEQTVDSLAQHLRTNVEPEPALTEEAYRADPEAGRRRLLRIASEPGTAVVCSQGGVIPDLVSSLARSGGLSIGEVHSRKASVWVLSFLTETHSGNGADPSPLLAAADYFPSPAPEGESVRGAR
ncbi:NUDIX hydrolase [Actinopolyspora erythraea]|uniref:NUDIX hydrolase n=1 Tax=Actinopolyspora erythraea TaxID=414996 RepID=A0A099D6P4_9ACTN|nr:NUDIX hydrolase [Actinopolyspora erythraea]ASU78090.1 NUDIX hydrolase [Actinopolyspora erythraea]KGI81704.1 NUDIX hydrolase [Actinopolyspora erythraea]